MRASMKSNAALFRLVLVLSFIFGSLGQSEALSSSSEPTTRSRWKTDRSGKPRLASVVEKFIGIGTRVGLFARSAENISVAVDAASNRDVIRGNLKQVAIHVKRSQGPLLNINELDVQGSDLKLGWWPTVFTILPFIMMKLRPSLFDILFYFGLYKLYSASQNYYNPQQRSPTLISSLKQKLHGKPCALKYRLILSENDVQHSSLLKIGLNFVLRSLMLNSVIGEAAALADASSAIKNNSVNLAEATNTKRLNNQPKFLLKPNGNNSNNLALGNQKSQRQSPSPAPKQQPIQRQEQMLTKLLEATSFQLANVTFVGGRMFWNADAIFPESNGQTKLSYVLRTTPQAVLDNQDQMIAFTHPECQFSLGAAIKGPFERFLPDLWIPVGPGVAVSMGRYQILGVETKDGSCQIDGRIPLFQKKAPIDFAEQIRENVRAKLSLDTKKGSNMRALKPSQKDDKQ